MFLVVPLAAGGKIVIEGHGRRGVRQQAIGKVAANESGATNDKITLRMAHLEVSVGLPRSSPVNLRTLGRKWHGDSKWLKCHAQHEIGVNRRQAQWPKLAMSDMESLTQFGNDLVCAVDVVIGDKPIIALPVALFENPLARDPSSQAICGAAFAWDYDGKLAVGLQGPPDLIQSSRQIAQVL